MGGVGRVASDACCGLWLGGVRVSFVRGDGVCLRSYGCVLRVISESFACALKCLNGPRVPRQKLRCANS